MLSDFNFGVAAAGAEYKNTRTQQIVIDRIVVILFADRQHGFFVRALQINAIRESGFDIWQQFAAKTGLHNNKTGYMFKFAGVKAAIKTNISPISLCISGDIVLI